MSFERQGSTRVFPVACVLLRTSALGQKGEVGRVAFNYLVGAGEHRRRNSNTERLSGLEVDNHLVFCRCLHRQVGQVSRP